MRFALSFMALGVTAALAQASESDRSLLLFSKTAGYRHASIANAIELVTSISSENGWAVTTTEDSSVFLSEGLSKYSSLVFLHTTGDFATNEEFEGLHQYLLNGGSWLGIHAAGDFGNNTPAWYNTLVGGQLERYPTGGNLRPDIVTIQDITHPSTMKLPVSQNRTDEWYSYRTNPSQSPLYTVLAVLEETYIDEITPEYLSMQPDHPISWHSTFEGKARSWYTGMGHTVESYVELYFVEHVTGGLKWVLGLTD
ncbi:PKD domain-containing protein [Plectosphaerella plurivora]|uniref:PKD domain-containing protein n=1 Tax=Plectosphaerella plurivora TaxID=936078 RepID=A0A9P8V455_9PEZI|nr:PKD domain-containing protein [Plectosphaerella plurivora]